MTEKIAVLLLLLYVLIFKNFALDTKYRLAAKQGHWDENNKICKDRCTFKTSLLFSCVLCVYLSYYSIVEAENKWKGKIFESKIWRSHTLRL